MASSHFLPEAEEKNIRVSCNSTNPRQKPSTQKSFSDFFSAKIGFCCYRKNVRESVYFGKFCKRKGKGLEAAGPHWHTRLQNSARTPMGENRKKYLMA